MSDSDPFVVLGVPRTVDPKELRRAYLRLVREHRPERDPEGFRRVREAYDAAAKWLELARYMRLHGVEVEHDEAAEVDEPARVAPTESEAGEPAAAEVPVPVVPEPLVFEPVVLRRADPALELVERARVEALDQAVSELDFDEAVDLLTDEWALVHIHRSPALIEWVLRVATGVMWNEPFLWERLMSHHGALIRAHQVRFAHGALVHLARCQLGAESWSMRAPPPRALGRLFRYGWTVHDEAFAATLREAAAEIQGHPKVAYASLVAAQHEDGELLHLWTAMLARRVPDAVGGAMAPAVAERLASDRVVRRRLQPPNMGRLTKLGALLVVTLGASLLVAHEGDIDPRWVALIAVVTLGLVAALLELGRRLDAEIGSPLYVARRCIELQAPIVLLPDALEQRAPYLVPAAGPISADEPARLLTLLVASAARLDSTEADATSLADVDERVTG